MVKHAGVWLDHKEARVFRIHPERTDETLITAPLHIETVDHPTDGQLVAHAKRYFGVRDR